MYQDKEKQKSGSDCSSKDKSKENKNDVATKPGKSEDKYEKQSCGEKSKFNCDEEDEEDDSEACHK